VAPDLRIRRLDGIRGVAVLLVVTYHASYLTAGWGPRLLPGGFVGVDLFFVLSGFLITTILLRERGRTGRVDLGAFARRRMLRLYPALAVLVGVVAAFLVALDRVGPGPGDLSGRELLWAVVGTLAYVSNYQQAAGWAYPIELSHTWSLAIEAQFYLVWPPILVALTRRRVALRLQVALLAVAMAAVAVHRASLWTDQAGYLPLYVRTDTRLDVLLAGCVLALVVHGGYDALIRGRLAALRLAGVLGVVVLGAASALTETGDERLYRGFGFSLIALAATAVTAAVLLDERGPLARAARWRPLLALGDRSYSLYLWHVPVFLTVARHIGDQPVALRVLTGLVVAAACTEVSYRLVEVRLRPGATPPPPLGLARWVRRHRRRAVAGAVVIGAFPMVVAVVALAQFHWYPVGDLAQAMMRQLSFWSDPPLVGPAGRIGTFARQGNHPGPAMFWFTWPLWWLLGRSSWAYQASVAGLVVGAYAASVWVARQVAGWRGAGVIAVVGAVLMRSFGPVVLTQPWNPYVPLVPFLLFAVACWAVACRRWGALPVAVAAGSFCVQCHVGYAPAAVAGLVVAVAAALAPDRLLPADHVVAPAPARRVVAWLAAGLVVGLAMWTPPLVDQVTRDPGNMTILVETYQAQTDEVIGRRAGTEILLTQLDPVGNWLVGTRRIQSPVIGGVVLVGCWLAGVVAAWRHRHGLLVRLHLVVGALAACAWFWAVRLDSTRLLYLVRWFWVVTALMVVATLWSAGIVLARRRPAWTPALTSAATWGAAGLLVVSTVSFTWTAWGVSPPDMRYSRTVESLAGPTASGLDPAQRYLVNWVDPDALGGNGFGLMLELERRGFDVGAVPPRSAPVEPHRTREPHEVDAVVTVVSGDDQIARARALPEAVELAWDDHRTPAEREEYGRVRAEVADSLREQGLGEVADGLTSSIWIGLNDPRVVGDDFDRLARLLELGQATAVFVSPGPLEGV
jgi:peptidoglycan/LPS O-acetylase OafA/YrhL